jgi:hypothetical protein
MAVLGRELREVYIRMPSDEEILKNYYASVYTIEVRDVKKIQLDQVTCQACDVCLETYRFELTVNAGDMQPLLDEGWHEWNEYSIFYHPGFIHMRLVVHGPMTVFKKNSPVPGFQQWSSERKKNQFLAFPSGLAGDLC